ncbi:MAG: permease [Candidatus Omnitrophica bacterium]|nr:permease [Candidatus Omnitrophota bacterium]
MEENEAHTCCAGSDKKKPWYKTGLFLTSSLTFVLLSASFVFPALEGFRRTFGEYVRMMFWPVLAGFFVGGLIDHYVPKEYISKHLSIPKKRTIFYSVGLGFLMSACCHGILAISMEIHKKGASGPAVVSFLLASPWANLPITILLFGFFGAKAFLIVLGAILVALITGLLMQLLARAGWIERNRHSVEVEEGFSSWRDILRRSREHEFSHENFWKAFSGVSRGAIALAKMVLPWILIGIVLGGLVSTFVPEHVFHHYFGPTLLGLLITMALATVLEVCSEGTSPLAFTIYQQTGAFGNAFAFLMGGVVTDLTEIGLVWKNLGPRTALWMLAISLPQVILLGWMLNKI